MNDQNRSMGLSRHRVGILTGVLWFVSCLAASAHGAWIHASSLPNGVSLPAAADGSYLFLEGETANEDAHAKLKNPAQKPATLFCTKRTPHDKYWTAHKAYDSSMVATRGAAVNLPAHIFTWQGISDHLKPGLYNVYVRSYIHPGGSGIYSLQSNNIKENKLGPVTNNKSNISWFRMGLVKIAPDTKSLLLSIATRKSQVQLDTVLLVAAKHVPLLRRLKSGAAWVSPSSLVFAADHAKLNYEAVGSAAIKKVTYSIQGANGHFFKRNAVAPLSGASGSSERWTIDLPSQGYYRITIQALGENGRKATQHIIAAVIGASLKQSVRSKSRFGIWTVSGDSKLSVLAGSRWNRSMVAFYKVTKKQAAQAAKRPSRLGDGTYKNKLEQIGVFSFGLPNWLMKLPKGAKSPSYGNSFYPATDWHKLSNVISAYAGQRQLPNLMEMYNEPLAHWHGSDKQLVHYAYAVRAGLKAVDKNFKLLGPCLYSIRIGDLRKLISHGLLDQLDGISMHAYVNGTPPEAEFYTKIKQLKALLRQVGKSDFPIYLTEFGWTTSSGTWQSPVDKLTQAQYCARSLVLCMAQDIKAAIYFCLQYDTHNKGEAGFGLVSPDGHITPGYVAYATVAKFFASAQPIGIWSIATTTKLVLAQRSDQVLAAVWDTEGKRIIHLPWRVTKAVDMMGRPVTLMKNNKFNIGKSPLYLQLDEPGLLHIKNKSAIKKTFDTAQAGVFTGDFLVGANNTNPLPGNYTIFKRMDSGWIAQPVILQRPLQIAGMNVQWPADKDNPQVEIALKSNFSKSAIAVHARLQETGQVMSKEIKPDSADFLVFSLPLSKFAPGKQAAAHVTVSAILNNHKITLHRSVAFTPLFASRVANVRRAPWPDADSAAEFWNPFPQSFHPHKRPEDCRAALQAQYGAAGLRLRVIVHDNDYQIPQLHETPSALWSKDSVQIGIDMDAGKPWQAGVIGGGFAGHRVFEFTVRQAAGSNKGRVYRQRSSIKSLPAKTIVKNAIAKVAYHGNVIAYDIFFPWQTLGSKIAPKPGQAVGLAIAVNDVDLDAAQGHRARHGLRLFGGIVQSKDPKKYGKLWLR